MHLSALRGNKGVYYWQVNLDDVIAVHERPAAVLRRLAVVLRRPAAIGEVCGGGLGGAKPPQTLCRGSHQNCQEMSL